MTETNRNEEQPVADVTAETIAESTALADIPQRDPDEVKAYHNTKRTLHIVGIFISLAFWIAACWWLPMLAVKVSGSIGSKWLGLGVVAVAVYIVRIIVDLPMDYYSGFVMEHRFGLSNQTFGEWVSFQIKGLLVGTVIGGIVLTGLYALLWYGGVYWSVWAWAGLMMLAVGLAKIFPLLILPLFYPSKPLDRPTLIERLTTMAEQAGMTITGVYDLAMSKETKKANAMLAGLGSSRRVYLSDTLLDAFNENQIAVVFAHELGHHIHKHIYKGIMLTTVVSSLMVALIHWRLNPYAGGVAEWASGVGALAEVMLVMTVWPLLISPMSNAISRHFERQADTKALQLTNDPTAFRDAFELLSRMNLADPNPPRWEEILFDDHPAIGKRIAMADAYVTASQQRIEK